MVKHSTSSTSKNNKPIIALDCDGVLLDFHAGYAQIYEKTFGKQLTLISPKSCRVSQILFMKYPLHFIFCRLKQGMVLNLMMKNILNLIKYGKNML